MRSSYVFDVGNTHEFGTDYSDQYERVVFNICTYKVNGKLP